MAERVTRHVSHQEARLRSQPNDVAILRERVHSVTLILDVSVNLQLWRLIHLKLLLQTLRQPSVPTRVIVMFMRGQHRRQFRPAPSRRSRARPRIRRVHRARLLRRRIHDQVGIIIR